MPSFGYISNLLRPLALRRRPMTVTAELPVTTGAEGALKILAPQPTGEEIARGRWRKRGQNAVRQEDWKVLARDLAEMDKARKLTHGNMPVADLMALGARSDVVRAVEHALLDGRPDAEAPLLAGITAFEEELSAAGDDPMLAAVVALTHIDIAWAWRGTGHHAQIPTLNREAFDAHMDRAAEILLSAGDVEDASPLLLTARARLLHRDAMASTTGVSERIDVFEKLIRLNPRDPHQMRNFGMSLLPRAGGSYDLLELEARRIAAQVSELWGAGGYTWTMLDAVSSDIEALAGLDVDYFMDGLHTILALRPDQFTANLLAAYCSITMSGDGGSDAADFNRARLHACREWIICDYVTELHPLVWAHATRGFETGLSVHSLERFARRGLKEGHRVLQTLFWPELARGQNVVFTENGPVTQLP